MENAELVRFLDGADRVRLQCGSRHELPFALLTRGNIFGALDEGLISQEIASIALRSEATKA